VKKIFEKDIIKIVKKELKKICIPEAIGKECEAWKSDDCWDDYEEGIIYKTIAEMILENNLINQKKYNTIIDILKLRITVLEDKIKK
jgi:hypothetical protein